jgi:hypothetical protein
MKKQCEGFARWFGWTIETPPIPHQMNQYNFFDVPEDKQQKFNSDLKAFLRSRKDNTQPTR